MCERHMKERRYEIHETFFKGLMGQPLVFVSNKRNAEV